MEEDDAGEMVSILVVEEDDEAENREDFVQQNEAGQEELGLEMSAGGGEKLKKLLNLWKRRKRASKMEEKRAKLWMRGTQGERLLAQIEMEL